MLVEFRITNLYSFDQETKLSMIPSIQSKTGTIQIGTINLLRFASIYGANASGKSNLVKAMRALHVILYKGTSGMPKDIFCRCREDNKEKESIIECVFSINSRFYAFGVKFLVQKGIITEEWIESISPKLSKSKTILRYKKGDTDINEILPHLSKDSADYQRLGTYIFDQNSADTYNTLLVNLLLNKKFEDRNMVFVSDLKKWFTSFDVNFAGQPIDHFSYMDKGEFSKVEKILNEFDTGIKKIYFEEISTEDLIERTEKDIVEEIKAKLEKDASSKKKNVSREMILRGKKTFFRIKLNNLGQLETKVIRLKHCDMECKFELYEESDGTVRLFDLLDIVLTGKEDMVYVVDEIDRSLHPVLLFKFMEIVKEEFADRRIQIIFTTHETHIMDLTLFRRDEIWFTEKNNQGISNVFSLDIFKERNSKIIKDGYIKGIYGGIPLFKKIGE